jgi:tRNA threonylcarbamoyladenosine biosynthesis protein TsaE
MALGRLLQSGDVVALIGDLGAGKTTLTKSIGAGMGILDDVTSPTFTLMHEYRGATPLFHLDPYRLDRPEDLAEFGLDDYLNRDGVLVVEWADRLLHLLPPNRLTIQFEFLPMSGLSTSVSADNGEALDPPAFAQHNEEDSGTSNAYFCLDIGQFQSHIDAEPRRITVLASGPHYEGVLAMLLEQSDVNAMIEREMGC